jgi:hypothetical protein
MLKNKSEELANKLGCNNFKATDGWLSQWKCRFGLKFKKDSAVAVSAEQWKSTKLPNLMQKCCTDDTVVYRPAAKQSLCKQRPFQGNDSVNMFLHQRILMQQ